MSGIEDLTKLIPPSFWDDVIESPTTGFTAPGKALGLLLLEDSGHLLLESGTTDALFIE